MTKRDDKLIVDGTVTDAFPGVKFNVELDNGHNVLAYASGKMRKYNIRIVLGDRVKLEISPYDVNRGRIIYRYKKSRRRPDYEQAQPVSHQTP